MSLAMLLCGIRPETIREIPPEPLPCSASIGVALTASRAVSREAFALAVRAFRVDVLQGQTGRQNGRYRRHEHAAIHAKPLLVFSRSVPRLLYPA